MLFGPFTLFKLRVFNIFRPSLGKKEWFCVVFCQEGIEGLWNQSPLESEAFGIFLNILPAIDAKTLLKWLAMIRSSDVVLLSIFRVSFWDKVLDVLVWMRVFIPYQIFQKSFLLFSKYALK